MNACSTSLPRMLPLRMLLLLSAMAAWASGSAELRVLMEVKAALDPGNRVLTTWADGADPCAFEGVACNNHGKVANISLQGRGLSGSLPPALAQLPCLTGLYLHYNSISGPVPREIGNLTDLVDLYLDVNRLSGPLPDEIATLPNLQVLQLCCNQFMGSIPTKLGMAKKLTVLALQSNGFTGAIPASLGDLMQLTRIDLSFNHLFGSIPTKLTEITNLQVLDVQSNNLSGNVPSQLTKLKEFRYGNNKGLCGVGFTSLRECMPADVLNPNRPEPYGPQSIPQSANLDVHCNHTYCTRPSKSPTAAIAAVIATISFLAVVSGIFTLTWYRRHKQKNGGVMEVSDKRLSTDQWKDFNRRSASPLINLEYSNGWDPLADGRSGTGFSQEVSQSFRFNLEEVECATQYFSEINLLGRSNFAATYKGTLRDGTLVAVKSINKTSCKPEETEFLKGLKTLTLLRHENLVALKGFCYSRGRGECFLLYDFIGNGTLLDYLDVEGGGSSKILDWPTRVSIIKGVAKGMNYLHATGGRKPALVHQNISANKVLIDQNLKPLLSSSGLYKLLADDVVFSTLKSSAAMGYLAPEYTTIGRFTEKSDVYAFGVIVFQILSGKKRIICFRTDSEAGKLEGFIDGNLNGKFSEPEAGKLVDLAMCCTNETPALRPSMDAVVQELC